MSDADSTLNILIKLGFIGADQADAVKRKLKEAKAATHEFAQATGEATEATKEQELHLEGLRTLFNGLNKIVPELGHILHAAFEGPLGPLILLGIGIAEVKEKLAAWNEELDAAGERAAQALTDGVGNLQKAWNTARESLGKYQAELVAAATDKDPTTTMIARQKELDAARLEGAKKGIVAYGQLAEAMLRANNGTEEQIARAHAHTTAMLDSLDNNKTPAELQKELEASRAAAPGLAAAAQAAVAPTIPAQVAVDNEKAELERLRKANDPTAKKGSGEGGLLTQGDIEELGEQAQREQEHVEIIRQRAERLGGKGASAQEQASAAILRQQAEDLEREHPDATKLAEATARMAKQRERQAQIERGETEAAQKLAEANERLATARAAELANQARLGELPGQIAQAQAVAAIATQAQTQTAAVGAVADLFQHGESPASIVRSGAAGIQDLEALKAQGYTVPGIEQAAAGARYRGQAGQALTPGDQLALQLEQQVERDQAAVERLGQLSAAAGISHDAIIKGFDAIIRNHLDLASAVANVSGVMDAKMRLLERRIQQGNFNRQ